MIRIGLAGLGIHGSRYAAHLLRGDVPGAKLAAVCRRDAAAGRAFAEENGIAFLPDPAEMATRPDVDAVVIALRPDLHAAAARACLAAGRPVLVEKPMATDVAEAAEIVRLAEGGSLLMVAQTLRFNALVNAMRRDAASLGAIHMISIGQHFEPVPRSWLDDPGPGGVLWNTAVHGLDLLRYLTGAEPVTVSAEVGRRTTERTEDQVSATVRLEPGPVLGIVDNSRTTMARSGRIEIVAERGILLGDQVHHTLVRYTGKRIEDVEPVPPVHTIEEALRAFVECIVEDSPPPVTARDGYLAVAMAAAARESADLGRRVQLADRTRMP
jgi:myo-inositol 2-dehydrogenase/D-chiro-inositol 1-dehydrogenase